MEKAVDAHLVPAVEPMGSSVGRNHGAGRTRLYEIPIILTWHPSRIPMRRMAPVHPAGEGHRSGPADTAQEQLMLDVFMVALGLGFFVAAVSYAYACERL
jgi:hypothetical protein